MIDSSRALFPHPTAEQFSVQFEIKVAEGIASEVLSAFRAVPRRGAEAGGILLGRIEGDHVHVEDFEPVLCEHRFGPSFVLDDEDERGLRETLDWFRDPSHGGVQVLGFYRSQTGTMHPERDRELLSRFFGDCIFLLLKPDRLEHITAELFAFWGGEMRPAGAPTPFPHDSGLEMPLAATPAPPESGHRTAEPPLEAQGDCSFDALPVPEVHAAPEVREQAEPAVEPRPAEERRLLAPSVRVREPEPETQEQRRPGPAWWLAGLAALTILGLLLGYRSTLFRSAPTAYGPVSKAPSVPAVSKQPVPVPAPAVDDAPDQASANVEGDVRAALGRWSNAMRTGNAALIADCYAPQLERYFTYRNASNADVRRTVMQTIGRFGRPAVWRISELSIVPVSQGRALATFRKHWQTAGPRIFAGEEQEQLTFERVRNAWKIASEQETKVYWTQRPR